MTRFYFNIHDGSTLATDPDGSMLADISAARSEAIESAREIVADLVRSGGLIDGQRIEIMDGRGILQATVSFRDAIRLA